MNITQIMNMFDWDIGLHEIKRFEVTKNTSSLYEAEHVVLLKIHPFGSIADFIVAFNNLTSEVYCITHDSDKCWANYDYLAGLVRDFENADITPEILSLDEMIDFINTTVNKEPDGFLPIDMDTDMLAAVDAEAAKLDISRNSFLTKVVLDFIKKGENETNVQN